MLCRGWALFLAETLELVFLFGDRLEFEVQYCCLRKWEELWYGLDKLAKKGNIVNVQPVTTCKVELSYQTTRKYDRK